MAQLVKSLPAMWETWVQSLAWEDPLERGMATHSRILAWRIPWSVQSYGVAKSQTRVSHFQFHLVCFVSGLENGILSVFLGKR